MGPFDEDPGVGLTDAGDQAGETAHLAAEDVGVKFESRFWIGRRQVDVMEAADLRILDDFDQGRPGIVDEGVADRAVLLDPRDDSHAVAGEPLHGVSMFAYEKPR